MPTPSRYEQRIGGRSPVRMARTNVALDELMRQRTTLEQRLRSLQPRPASPSPAVHDVDLCMRACRAVGDFLDNAGPEDRALALEALQIAIRSTPTEAVVHGVVPIDPDVHCHANNHADARFPVNDGTAPAGVQFVTRVRLGRDGP